MNDWRVEFELARHLLKGVIRVFVGMSVIGIKMVY